MPTLFLIPTSLSNNNQTNAILPSELDNIKHLKHFIVETAKIARIHLKQLDLATKLQELDIQELNKHTTDINQLIQPLHNGFDIGIMSDCGLPAIADPGHQVVKLAHQHDFKIKPLVGPSSLMLALMASGVNGQSFAFQGYLPIEASDRINKIKQLQKLITDVKQSQIIIETPFRNQALLGTLIQNLSPDTTLALAINLMSLDEKIISQTISRWKQMEELPNLQKKEVVFILGLSLNNY
jgi:16S rRNA (cytidine1402-2'-O)-methyltransferase